MSFNGLIQLFYEAITIATYIGKPKWAEFRLPSSPVL